MSAVREINGEPLPGFRLLERLEEGEFGEAWKCQAPDGYCKLTFYEIGNRAEASGNYRVDPNQLPEFLRTYHLLQTLQHPALIRIERIVVCEATLLVVSELAEKNLRTHWNQYRDSGRPGIPRQELLGYLEIVADLVDLLNTQHRLSHLEIQPDTLYLRNGQVKVDGSSVTKHLLDATGSGQQGLGKKFRNPAYVAPERYFGSASPHSDQYSLAVTFQELLTASLPYTATTIPGLALQHHREEPHLAPLMDADQMVVRKALSRDPGDRFPSCREFIQGLLNSVKEGGPNSLAAGGTPIPRSQAVHLGPASSGTSPALASYLLEEIEEDPASLEVTPPLLDSPTVPASSSPTDSGQVSLAHPVSEIQPQVNTDPLAGFQFLDALARTTHGEVWRVRSPQREEYLVQLIFGHEPKPDVRGRHPFDRLNRLEHPGIFQLQAIPTPGRLILISNFPDKTLYTLLRQAQENNQPGISRETLLDYLGKIADVLDHAREAHSLMHLGLTPGKLVLDEDGEIYLAELGLVELFLQPSGQNPALLNPHYAAPELYTGTASPQSDLYSLALIYVELLTGTHPFQNLNRRQLASTKTRGEPDLSMTTAVDRSILSAALEADPQWRYRSCREFIDALTDATRPTRPRAGIRQAMVALPPLLRRPALDRVLRELTDQVSQGEQVVEFGRQRSLLLPGKRLRHFCHARMVISTVPLKLQAFCERWQARVISSDPGSYTLQIRLATSVLERFLGRKPLVELKITLQDHQEVNHALTTVQIDMRVLGCNASTTVNVLEQMGPALIDSLRHFLQADAERRKYHRFPLDRPATLYPVLHQEELGNGISGQTHNVSLAGLGVYLRDPVGHEEVAVHLTSTNSQGVLLAGRVVRQRKCTDGRFDVGIHFDEIPSS